LQKSCNCQHTADSLLIRADKTPKKEEKKENRLTAVFFFFFFQLTA
jgi:hypothetical protein